VGVTYWDTANSYEGGNSEKGIGKYFAKYPEDRKKIFLVTKSTAWTQSGMSEHLALSLERMQTDHIDLFFVHAVRRPSSMDKDMKQWGEKAKAQGKIRFFGFSTHSNMEECLLEAAKLGWIDGIMLTYNYRLMHTDAMRRAVDACARAGIGLTAMKTQGGGQVLTSGANELNLGGRFLQSGFTQGQASSRRCGEPSDRQHLLADAQHGAAFRKHRRGREQDAAVRPGPRGPGLRGPGQRRRLLRRLHPILRTRPRRSSPCRQDHALPHVLSTLREQ